MINTERAPKYTATYLWLKYIYMKLKYNIDYMQALIQVSKELPVLLIQMVSKELLSSGDWGVDELPVGLINIYTCRYLYVTGFAIRDLNDRNVILRNYSLKTSYQIM